MSSLVSGGECQEGLGTFGEGVSLWCPFCGSELIQIDGGHTGHLQNPCSVPAAPGDAKNAFLPSPVCSSNSLSTQSQTGTDQRYWGQCHPMSSFGPDISVSVPVSNILPHSSMSYQSISVISLFLYPNCIFYMASSTQKPCKSPAEHEPEFGVWKMFILRKATDEPLFC